jgi:hypothetical protein
MTCGRKKRQYFNLLDTNFDKEISNDLIFFYQLNEIGFCRLKFLLALILGLWIKSSFSSVISLIWHHIGNKILSLYPT